MTKPKYKVGDKVVYTGIDQNGPERGKSITADYVIVHSLFPLLGHDLKPVEYKVNGYEEKYYRKPTQQELQDMYN